ncbi:hypothetical protein EDD86DRAFT_210208 [Gorgonomyces haynaldii]|nr:hypothetical protein EDD86DRAFT_210208 [Gorgonomyces haynaldii]
MYVMPSDAANPFQSFVRQEYEIGFCGNFYHQESTHCCYSSLDTLLSNGVQSGFQTDEDIPLLQALPKSASGQNYCHVVSSGLFDGYDELYLIADGSCIDDRYSCQLNPPALKLYNDTGCQQPMAIIPVAVQSYSDYGIARVTIETVQGSLNSFIWTSLTPSAILIPDFHNLKPLEVLAIALFALGFVFSAYMVYHYWLKYYESPSKSMLYKLIMHIFWLLLVIAKFIYWTAPLDWYAIYSQVMCCIYNFATLTIALHSAAFLNKYSHKAKPWMKQANIVLLVFIHLALAGAWYIDYFRCVYTPISEFVSNWNNLTSFWILFVFVYDLIPSYITIKLLLRRVKKRAGVKMRQVWLSLAEQQPILFVMIVGQIVIIICDVALIFIKKFTTMLGDDRMYLASESIVIFLLMSHALLTCIFLDYVPRVLGVNPANSSRRKNHEDSVRSQDVMSRGADLIGKSGQVGSDGVSKAHNLVSEKIR